MAGIDYVRMRQIAIRLINNNGRNFTLMKSSIDSTDKFKPVETTIESTITGVMTTMMINNSAGIPQPSVTLLSYDGIDNNDKIVDPSTNIEYSVTFTRRIHPGGVSPVIYHSQLSVIN